MRLRTELAILIAAFLFLWNPHLVTAAKRLEAIAKLIANSDKFTTSLRATSDGTNCNVEFGDIDDSASLIITSLTSTPSLESSVTVQFLDCNEATGKRWYLTNSEPILQSYDNNVINPTNDPRLWRITSCGTSSQNAFYATLYYLKTSTIASVLTLSHNQLQLVDRPFFGNGNVSCTDGYFVYLYPAARLEPDPCVPQILSEVRQALYYTVRFAKRDTPESLNRLLRLIIVMDNHRFVVVRSRHSNSTFADELIIEPFSEERLSADSLFYYTNYITADRSGEMKEFSDEATFTLLHALTKQYLIVDVDSQSMALKTGGSFTGVKFRNSSDFLESPLMDIRHFKAYKKVGGRVVICAQQYRNFCFVPKRNGSLCLYPVGERDVSNRPTFKDPTNDMLLAFGNASRRLAGSIQIPTFEVFERRTVVAVGVPQIVYISLYTASSGNAQNSGSSQSAAQTSVLTYDPATNSLIMTTLAQALSSPYRIVRRQWSEQGSPAIYISLQIVSGSLTSLSTAGLYITRMITSPEQVDSPFGSVDVDSRLFNTRCCFCSQNVNEVQWVYYNKGSRAISLAVAQNGTLIWREDILPPNPSCQTYAFTFSTS